MFDAVDGDFYVVEGVGVGEAHVAFAVFAEGGTPGGGDAEFVEEALCEFFALESEAGDVGEYVECAVWHTAAYTVDFVERFNEIVTSFDKSSAHFVDCVLRTCQGFDACDLAEC